MEGPTENKVVLLSFLETDDLEVGEVGIPSSICLTFQKVNGLHSLSLSW